MEIVDVTPLAVQIDVGNYLFRLDFGNKLTYSPQNLQLLIISRFDQLRTAREPVVSDIVSSVLGVGAQVAHTQ